MGSVNKGGGGAVVSQILCIDHGLLLICGSGSCTWFEVGFSCTLCP